MAVESLPDNDAPASASGKRRGLVVNDDTTIAAAAVVQSWEIYFDLTAGQEAEAAADSLLAACQLTSPDCALSGVTAEGVGDGGGAATLTRPLTSGPLNAQIPNLAGSGVVVSRAARPGCP